jgi:hypothetical protein
MDPGNFAPFPGLDGSNKEAEGVASKGTAFSDHSEAPTSTKGLTWQNPMVRFDSAISPTAVLRP